jgi:hypothetical protein
MYQWLTVTLPDGSKRSEIPYEVLITSFNSSRIVVQLLYEKYGLIDSNGINKQKLEEFFNVQREDLSEKYLKTVTVAKEDAKLLQQQYAAKVGKVKPHVKNDGTVVSGGAMGTKIIGKITTLKRYIFNNGNHVGYSFLICILLLQKLPRCFRANGFISIMKFTIGNIVQKGTEFHNQ